MRTEKMISEIGKADAGKIDVILEAAMSRKRELYPDWEIFYCAAEKSRMTSPEEMIRAAWEFEQRIRGKYDK